MEKENWELIEGCARDTETFGSQVIDAYKLMAEETPLAMITGARELAEAMQ